MTIQQIKDVARYCLAEFGYMVNPKYEEEVNAYSGTPCAVSFTVRGKEHFIQLGDRRSLTTDSVRNAIRLHFHKEMIGR